MEASNEKKNITDGRIIALRWWGLINQENVYQHGSLNVPIEHHPTIRYMVYNGYSYQPLINYSSR